MFAAPIVAKTAVVGLGLFVALQGYQAAKRERSQRMLLTAGGFTLLSVGSVLEGICQGLFHLSAMVAGLIQTGIVRVRMALIVLSLFIPGSTDKKESVETPGGDDETEDISIS